MSRHQGLSLPWGEEKAVGATSSRRVRKALSVVSTMTTLLWAYMRFWRKPRSEESQR